MYFTILAFLLLSSCSSTVTKDLTISKFAPKDYQPAGQVKYLNEGAKFIVESRREDAFKKMHEMCKGAYEIIHEGAENTSPSYHAGMNSIYTTRSQYVYIDFKCSNREPASN